jgi:DNA processing protein
VLERVSQVQATDNLKDTFGNLPETLNDSRQRWISRFSEQSVSQALRVSKQLALKLLLSEDPNWPTGLNDLGYGAPAILFVQGNEKVLANTFTGVSIVGSRLCTTYGAKVTEKLVGELALANRMTVSGGAIGIDSHVHNQSLNRSLPTVAVMAGGLDRKYPNSNHNLFEAITRTGALIGELPPGVAPTRWRFLQRNRLIAALTPTSVVVEAVIRSGSIRTANNAVELSRDLFAVPGPVLSAASAGTNYLIAEGKAKALFDTRLVTDAASEATKYLDGSALLIRAQDAIRELRLATGAQIAKIAGLTEFELSIALDELRASNQLTWNRDSLGSLHYALKYANRA